MVNPMIAKINVKVGDKVRYVNSDGIHFYRVTGVYKYVFTATDTETGVKTSFEKAQIIDGEVKVYE